MPSSRKLALLAALAALLTQTASGRAVIRSLPASRLARQVVVYRDGVEQARMSAPGSRDVLLPCTHVDGHAESLQLEVTSLEPKPPADCREVEPAKVPDAVALGRTEELQFVDTLGADLPGAVGPLTLPDGRTVAVARASVTVGKVLCFFPAGEGAAQVARGERVRLWGTAFRMPNGAPALLVEGSRAEPADGLRDEPPWQVTARWGGQEVLNVKKPGDYSLRMPCENLFGAWEQAGVRVREFRVADIQVDGHPVAAELAVTPQAMSYGLQGRAGLDRDCGMLFCFPAPDMPTFVMKTVSFPLSIAFIRDDGVIVNIVRLDPGDRRYAQPLAPVSYVLEMEQGWFQKHGVAPGKKVVIP